MARLAWAEGSACSWWPWDHRIKPRPCKRPAARSGRGLGGAGQRPLQPPPPLAVVPADVPEHGQRPGHPQDVRRVAGVRQVGERRADVGELGIEAPEAVDAAFARPDAVRVLPLAEGQEVGGVGVLACLPLARLPHPFQGVLADRLQHPEPDLAVGARLPAQQAAVDQRRDEVDDGRRGSRVEGGFDAGWPPSATASAASIVQPPTKTARRRKSRCSASVSRS